MTLTKFERLTLANQFRLLAAAYPLEKEEHLQAAVALERGYSRHYPVEHISDELSPKTCDFVYEVLDMYSWLQQRAVALEGTSVLGAKDLEFPGFDGNGETEYMAYTRHVIEVVEDFKGLRIDSFNSHRTCVPQYEAMLERFAEEGGIARHDEAAIRRILG